MKTCDDCRALLTHKNAPEGGWELEDGRVLCYACCAKDLRGAAKILKREWYDALRSPLYWLCLFLLAALVLVSCGGLVPTAEVPASAPTILESSPNSKTFVKGIGFDTVRIEDYEAGVVCYLYDSGSSTGASLDCVAMSLTNLGGR